MTDAAKLTPYQWRLFFFLSVATFFEGYDSIALSQILPEFRHELHADTGDGGLVVAFINAGTIVAYLLVRQADRWGRRRMLTITIAGYTIATLLSGLAPSSTFLGGINAVIPGVWIFAFFQLIGRVFLIAEWAISMMFAAEEFPAQKRGLMIGLIQAFSALGSVVCAGAVPLIVAHTPWGWRTVYFVGTVPLVLLAIGRRSIKESSRFESLDAAAKQPHSLFRIWGTPSRKRVIQLALIWGFTYLCTQTSVTFWKEYAVAPAPAPGPHFTTDEVGQIIMFAAIGAMPLVFIAGKLLDWLGRRMAAVIIFLIAAGSCVSAYTLTENKILITMAVCGAIFGSSSVLPVLNAYTTELFPTELRGDAFAWSNNLLGRLGYVAAPALVGFVAQDYGWGLPVAITAVGPIIALVLILLLLPETRGKELEETALMH